MSVSARSEEWELVRRQLGREPREPWSAGSRCPHGYPNSIVSPSVLDDGSRFPTFVWLTCPWLRDRVSSLESDGATAQWTQKLADDGPIAERLLLADAALRAARRSASPGEDACASVGIAGQSDVMKVKCLHAHVALSLYGIDDPIGEAVLVETGDACGDRRCRALAAPADGSGGRDG